MSKKVREIGRSLREVLYTYKLDNVNLNFDVQKLGRTNVLSYFECSFH